MTNDIIEFKTNKIRGFFISVPFNTLVEKCHIKDKESMPFALMVCHGSKDSIPSYYPIVLTEADYTILGLSNKLNEYQITQLGLTFHEYIRLLNEYDIVVNYSDYSNLWLVIIIK
jgi:hypothetical protein